MTTAERLEIDGRQVSAEVAVSIASGFGHFTAMQVRGRRTRGLTLHLARLEAANRELFGGMLHQRDHSRLHEPSRSDRLTGPGHLRDLHHAASG